MLDDARKKKLMDLFAEGIELPQAERTMFVSRTCADDAQLRQELTELLEVRCEEGFLNGPAISLPASASVPVIPGYEELVLIGEGGMGAVYRAKQVSPVQRTVALKLIRLGMDSSQVLARFDAERQALARMAHPGIATVLDAGEDQTGRPYLTMEYVDGTPITDYCATHGLELEARLELFAKVCDAIDHAHRRGVLHRDLKPSNVLVSHDQTGPSPKVIDFGIAKALEGQLGDDSIHTRQGSLLGTPEYMSPEQLDGDGRSIDTRTDVYALGAMLYELLTSERPFDSARLREAGITGLARIVREELPPRPSTRVRERVATTPGTGHWSRRLHHDLDWVVMKALEKEPDRRYASPREMADDVRRFLRHQPVEAGPPSGIYKLRRFARRYRLQLAALTAVIAALTIGLFGTLWFLFESVDNEARAIANAQEAEGTRLAATAALVTKENPNLALLLAIEADELTDDFTVHETILGALPHQNLVGRFQYSDYGTTKAIFLDDGSLLSCGVDPVFWLTDIDAGKLVRRYVGHAGRVFDLAVSPSQSLVATASADTTARIWNLADGNCQYILEHPDQVVTIHWSPDNRLVGTTCRDGVARLFSAATGELVRSFGEGIGSLAFGDGGQLIATQDSSYAVALWSTEGAAIWTIATDSPPAPDARYKPGQVSFAASDTRLVHLDRRGPRMSATLMDSSDGRRIATFRDSRPLRSIGGRLLLHSADGVAAVSLDTGEVVEQLTLEGLPTVFAVADDGRRAIAFNDRENVCLVDLESGRTTHRLSGENDKNWRNRWVAFHPDGERFVVTGRELLVWRFEAEYEPFQIPVERQVAKGETRVHSLVAAAEALALLRHQTDTGARWSLWSIDQRRKLRDLPMEGLDDLRIATDGSHLHGYRDLPSAGGQAAKVEIFSFDLEGRVTNTVTVSTGLRVSTPLRPEGGLFAFVLPSGDERVVNIIDAQSGTARYEVKYDRGSFMWGSGPEARFAAVSEGSRTRTLAFDLRTSKKIASIVGPAGAGHYGVAIDEQRERMLVVLGDRRARLYDLRNPDEGHTGEYTRIVRSNGYPCGFLPDGSMAWVMCANEVHLFDAVSCKPFAAIRLSRRAQLCAARADSSELVTVTDQGRCERWPLDTGTAAKRFAHGPLTKRERDLYRVGTPHQRIDSEAQRLAALDTSRSHAMRGELMLQLGDLDEAIACYQRCCEIGPLAPMDLRRYLRLLELLAQRHEQSGRTADERSADILVAAAVLPQAVRCGATRETLEALPGFRAMARHDELRRLLPE